MLRKASKPLPDRHVGIGPVLAVWAAFGMRRRLEGRRYEVEQAQELTANYANEREYI